MVGCTQCSFGCKGNNHDICLLPLLSYVVYKVDASFPCHLKYNGLLFVNFGYINSNLLINWVLVRYKV